MSWNHDADDLVRRIRTDGEEFKTHWGIHSYALRAASVASQTGYFLIHRPHLSILTEPRPAILLVHNDSLFSTLETHIESIETAPETLLAKKKHPIQHALVITGLRAIFAEHAPEPYRTDDTASKEFRTGLHVLAYQGPQ